MFKARKSELDVLAVAVTIYWNLTKHSELGLGYGAIYSGVPMVSLIYIQV
jgi:hypothetical protein